MSIEIKVPEVGESIREVLIGDWLKSEGDHVERDEDIVVIETDKATVEVPAPDSGTLTQVLKKSGDKAAVGDVIAYLEEGKAQSQKDGARKVKPETAVASNQERPEKVAERKGTAEKPVRQKEQDNKTKRAANGDAVKWKRSEEETKEPEIAAGKEKEKPALHKATKEVSDVEEADTGKEKGSSKVAQPGEVKPGRPANKEMDGADEEKAEEVQTGPSEPNREERVEKVVPVTLIRRRIAEHLVQAQQTTASLTTFNEIDMSAVKSLRDEHREAFQEKYQIKLGFMSFFVKATVEALKLVPQINAEMRGADLIFRNYCDIGIAVGGGKGLVVPVLRDADRMSFAAIEQSIADFARRAESKRLKPQDLEGGTFTISNGGIYGSLLSTPILNFPQSGILGLHAIQERPVVRNGEVIVRPMMYVALTYDHRVVDGREAVTFLKRIKECIEAPARMLLEI
jgi:2-oxoglutarate dehydrogenase E2 component (dihydrolipoamide succinyltransferase)